MEMLTVKQIAEVLCISPRQVARLADSGRLPAPLHIGRLIRWPREAITEWIVGGCKPVRHVDGAR